MSKLKKRRSIKKQLAQRGSSTNRQMLGINNSIYKRRLKKRRIIEETKTNIRNNQAVRDFYIRGLVNMPVQRQKPIRKTIERQIISHHREIQNDRRFIICVKRADRRQSLFSQKRAGKGIPGPKRKIMTEKSKVRC